MESNYYTSLKETPLSVWIELNDSKDLSALCKSSEGATMDLLKAYYSLIDEQTERFGRPENYQDVINKKMELAQLFCDYLISGDRFIKFQAEVVKKELLELETPGGSQSIYEEKSIIEKRIGFYLDPEKISTLEYLYKKNGK